MLSNAFSFYCSNLSFRMECPIIKYRKFTILFKVNQSIIIDDAILHWLHGMCVQ